MTKAGTANEWTSQQERLIGEKLVIVTNSVGLKGRNWELWKLARVSSFFMHDNKG